VHHAFFLKELYRPIESGLIGCFDIFMDKDFLHFI